MSRKNKLQIKILDNPEKPFTSPRRAELYVETNLAVWVVYMASIRFRSALEVRLERRERQKRKEMEFSDRDIAVQRGGRDLSVRWRVGKVRATRNQPEWMPKQLGYSVMGADVVSLDQES